MEVRTGIGRCAFCGWQVTGSMKQVIAAQAGHREQHGVRSHPNVRRTSANVKRAQARLTSRKADGRAKVA